MVKIIDEHYGMTSPIGFVDRLNIKPAIDRERTSGLKPTLTIPITTEINPDKDRQQQRPSPKGIIRYVSQEKSLREGKISA